MRPIPLGTCAVVEFAGGVRLPSDTIRFRRKMVQRATPVDAIVGVGVLFEPALHVPSCGGGGSSGSEFGTTPTELFRNTESWTTRCPPAFVAENPSAFRSESACVITARQSGQAPTYSPESLKPLA